MPQQHEATMHARNHRQTRSASTASAWPEGCIGMPRSSASGICDTGHRAASAICDTGSGYATLAPDTGFGDAAISVHRGLTLARAALSSAGLSSMHALAD
jgi:hypothetical protein